MTNKDSTASAVDRASTVLAHRHTLIRQGLATLLGDLGFGPVTEADSTESLMREAARVRPEIILLDWGLSGDTVEAITKLASFDPKPAVVVLVTPDSQKDLQPALKAGANGYLSVNITADELGDSLRLLARGGVIVSGEMAGAMSGQGPAERATEAPGGLSGREREVLGLVASGATNREIAEALVVTENTVKVHLRNVLDKLNLRNRQQATAFAVREGIVIETTPLEEKTGGV